MKFVFKIGLLLGASMALPTIAEAQSAAEAPATSDETIGDEILVTARRRVERIQDVPSTIASVTGAQLSASGGRKLSDLNVSGLTFVSLGGAQPLVSVRGDANRIGVTEPGTGVFIDGIYVVRQTQLGVGPIDVQRVEVLKGPQSTLYGKNTIAGAINILTNDPTWDWLGEAEAGYGRGAHDDENLWHVQGIISGPIVADKLAIRLTAARQKRDGYVSDPVTEYRGLGYNATYVRLKTWLKAADNVDWRLSIAYRKDNAPRMDVPVPFPGATVYLGRPGLSPTLSSSIWDTGSEFQPYSRSTSFTVTSDLSINTDIGTVTALSNYQRSRTRFLTNVDTTRFSVGRQQVTDHNDSLSQEIRLSGAGGGFNWLAGFYFLHDRQSDLHQVFTFLPDSANYLTGVGSFRVDLPTGGNTYAGFGQFGYAITPRLTVSGGLRVASDRREGFESYSLFNLDGRLRAALVPHTPRGKTFNSVTGNGTISYKIDPDAMVYATYSTGTKAGGFSATTVPAAAVIPYKEQRVKAIEVGMKSDLFGRRTRLNVAAFYNRYTDLQLQQTVVVDGTVSNLTTNAARSRAYGVDVELHQKLIDHVRFDLGYTYLNARIQRYDISATLTATDLPIPRSPKHSGTAGLTYTHALGSGELSLGGSMDFKSNFTNDISPSGTNVLLAPVNGYHLINATASYKWDRYEVSAYMRNIANKQYYLSQVIINPASYYYGTPGAPRTFEVTAKVIF